MENDTQVCDLSWNRTQELNEEAKEDNPVGLFSCEGQKLLVFRGKKYVVGRGADADLSVSVKSLSARHIQIEVIGESHLIKDLGSKNKTMRGDLVLIPNVFYELPDSSEILLGDTKACYTHVKGHVVRKKCIIGSSEYAEPIGDKTKSSWLDITSHKTPNWSSTPAKSVRIQEEVQAVEISADGSSELDLIPASQFIPQLDESAVMYVEDSPVKCPAKTVPSLQVPETPRPNKKAVGLGEIPLNLSDELAKDTSLLNTIKELQTLAQLQGQATSIPNSQIPDFSFEENGSECGSEIVDLNMESGENGIDSPIKIPDSQADKVESEDDGTMDDANTQCWDTVLGSDKEEEDACQKKVEVFEKEALERSEDECNISAETATVSDSETANTSDVITENALEDTANTSDVITENAPDDTAHTSDVITKNAPDDTANTSDVITENAPYDTANTSDFITKNAPDDTANTSDVITKNAPDDTANKSDVITVNALEGTANISDVTEKTADKSGVDEKVDAANSSDMEITCVDNSRISSIQKDGCDTSMFSDCMSAGAFSPTSAPPTQADDDSEATDIDDNVMTTPKPVTEPEDSVIESPVMSESELENSLDRKDKYRRSMVKSMAEDSQMWATILSTKTSSSDSIAEEDVEKTPPRYDDGLARTPPKVSKESASPVATPLKVLGMQVNSPEAMFDISDGLTLDEAELTQDVIGTKVNEDVNDVHSVRDVAEHTQDVMGTKVNEDVNDVHSVRDVAEHTQDVMGTKVNEDVTDVHSVRDVAEHTQDVIGTKVNEDVTDVHNVRDVAELTQDVIGTKVNEDVNDVHSVRDVAEHTQDVMGTKVNEDVNDVHSVRDVAEHTQDVMGTKVNEDVTDVHSVRDVAEHTQDVIGTKVNEDVTDVGADEGKETNSPYFTNAEVGTTNEETTKQGNVEIATEKAAAVEDVDSDATDDGLAGVASKATDDGLAAMGSEDTKEPVMMLLLGDGTDTDDCDEDDDLKITGVQDACSLEITHVKDVQDSCGEDTDDFQDEGTPCTLDLDLKIVSGTDEFDVKVKGEPASQEGSKAFLSMFEMEDGDAAVLDSQLNTLGDDAAFQINSPDKRGRRNTRKQPPVIKAAALKRSPINKATSRKGKQPPNKQQAIPTKARDTSDSEFEDLVLPPRGKAKRQKKKDNNAAIYDSKAGRAGNLTEVVSDDKPTRPHKAPATVLKLDAVEELLRKRREIKHKLDAKEVVVVSKNKNKRKAPKRTEDDEDDLPEFGLMDSCGSDSDEIIELDLITSCSKPPACKKDLAMLPVVEEPPAQVGTKRKPRENLFVQTKKGKVVVATANSERPSRASKAKKPLIDLEDSQELLDSISTSRSIRNKTQTESHASGKQLVSKNASNTKEKSKKKVDAVSDDEESNVESQTTRRIKPVSISKERPKRSTAQNSVDSGTAGERVVNTVESVHPDSSAAARGSRSRNARLTEDDCTYSASVETCSVDKVADKESFDDLDNTPNINPLRSVEASPRALRRRTKTTSSEASPAPSISKRGRVRKVKSEVRDLLSAAKQELDPKTARGRKVGLAVKKEDDEETEVRTGQGSKRKGTQKRKPEIKEESDSKLESSGSIRKESPVITVGRGKRKKTSAPVKDEAQSPVAAIVNSSYKFPTTPSRRASAVTSRPEIVYTGITASDAMKRSISGMGGLISEDITTCTHLVTDNIKRTSKFLCAIGRGIPIVSESWLKESNKSKSFREASDFAIKDMDMERKYQFTLTRSLENATKCPFLSGWTVYVTKSCQPSPAQFDPIISCNGGLMLKRVPKSSDQNVIIIATEKDNLKTLNKSGHPICSTELILTGALRQELAIKAFNLRQNSPEL